jgi:hypothetical protein
MCRAFATPHVDSQRLVGKNPRKHGIFSISATLLAEAFASRLEMHPANL